MITIEFLRDLYAHMEWADARVWAAAPSATPPDDVLRNTLLHIHIVQRAFLYVWTNRPFMDAVRKPEDFNSLAEIRAWGQPYYAEARAFLETLDNGRLKEPIAMPWAAQVAKVIGREPATTLLGDTCFQAANHTTHHRGQVNSRLRIVGAEPPPVDYIFWVWLGRPAPEWT
jgi:uncharacterized damage-inducible protein DinB